MKIAVNARFLLPDKLEGIGKFSHEIIKRLAAQHPEHQFYLFFDRPYDKQFIYAPNITPVVLYPHARHPVLYYIWFELRVAQALKKIKPDVFFSPDGFTVLNTEIPRVTVMHDIAFEHYPEDVGYTDLKYYRYISPRTAQVSNKIIAVSEFTKKDIAQKYKISLDKFAVVYNDAGPHCKPSSFEQQVKIRQQYSLGEAFFLFVGAIQPRKNLVNLFAAFDKFKTVTGSEVKLVIVGRKAWKAKSITNAYQNMQFKHEVIFTGRVSDTDLVNLYGAAVATVYVPTLEGFGIPIVEAQNCHCPVITSNTSSMPEVAGESAMLVNPFAIEDIVQALITVYHQLEVRAHFIKAGIENTKRFSWDKSAEKVMEILEEAGRPIS